jgi:UDP-N-acetylmuramate dehydrogenase
MTLSSSARCAVASPENKLSDTGIRSAKKSRVIFRLTMSKSDPKQSELGRELSGRLEATRLRLSEPLGQYTTFRIGGPADFFYESASADDLAKAVAAARELGIQYFILGLGANILVGDNGFRGLVIRNTGSAFEFGDDGRLRVESGAVMAKLIPQAVERNWSGLEHYVGIPSTVGGAVWQNLHFLSPAPERERTMFIAEVVESCELLGADGKRRLASAKEMAFGYDTSILHKGADVALAVNFQLEHRDSSVMHRIMQENLSWRGGKHPWLEYHPSAGSIFQKIEGVGAGRLVEQVGLKGFRLGGAQFSHIHANIMVNLGGATAKDVRELIALAQSRVAEQLGYKLKPEIGFIGEF